MENDPSFKSADDDELCAILRTLRVETVREVNFEERFLFEFHERLVREAVCRPARTLLWEHLMHALGNMGGRKLLWGVSSLGIGVTCLSVLIWQNSSSHTSESAEVLAVGKTYGSDTVKMASLPTFSLHLGDRTPMGRGIELYPSSVHRMTHPMVSHRSRQKMFRVEPESLIASGVGNMYNADQSYGHGVLHMNGGDDVERLEMPGIYSESTLWDMMGVGESEVDELLRSVY